MATFTAARAALTFPAQGHGYSGALYSCWGTITISANPADGDFYKLCKTPSGSGGFIALGGWLASADLDTGTEVLDLDLGWAANGTAAAAAWVAPSGATYTDSGYAASVDGLGNFGVWSGDAITDLKPAGSNYRPIVLSTPLWFAKPTTIQLEANVAANAFAAGAVTVCLIGNII